MMDITLVIAIIGCVIGIMSFFFARKDKGEKDTEASSYKMGQIEAKIDFISKQITLLSDKFDKYDTEVDEKIQKAMDSHIMAYHKG
jgi:flagellar biosynthesis chaperone FliJ